MQMRNNFPAFLVATVGLLALAAAAWADVVVCFGDSNTAGGSNAKGGPPGTGYPAHLQNMVKHSIVNAGKGGEMAISGVGRIGGVIAGHKPKYVLIMEGTNDVHGGVSASTIAYNLGRMADTAKQYGASPVFSTIPPDAYSSQGARVPSVNSAIAAMASGRGVPCVDSYSKLAGNWKAYCVSDGLHTNSEGAKIIAQAFASAIGGGGDGGGGGCFIATAAFGSYMEPHVMILRQFRDMRLLTSAPGQWFVRKYYQYSPPAADYIARRPMLKGAVRIGLLPLVGFAWMSVHYPAALIFMLAGACLALGAFISRRRRLRPAC